MNKKPSGSVPTSNASQPISAAATPPARRSLPPISNVKDGGGGKKRKNLGSETKARVSESRVEEKEKRRKLFIIGRTVLSEDEDEEDEEEDDEEVMEVNTVSDKRKGKGVMVEEEDEDEDEEDEDEEEDEEEVMEPKLIIEESKVTNRYRSARVVLSSEDEEKEDEEEEDEEIMEANTVNDNGKGKGIMVEEEDEDEEDEDEEENEEEVMEANTVNDNGKGKGVMVEEEVMEVKEANVVSGKGKGVMVQEEVMEVKEANVVSGKGKGVMVQEKVMEVKEANVVSDGRALIREIMIQRQKDRKAEDRYRAISLAPKFAICKAAKSDSDDEDEDDKEKEEDVRSLPGPCSTAMQLIVKKREENGSDVRVRWVPKSSRKEKPLERSAPSLRDLCMKMLYENAEHIESLDGVPDMLKSQLVARLCQTRKMGPQFFCSLVRNAPTEIRVSDCSWATEEQFEEAFAACNTEELKVVQLDLSGRCLPNYVLRASLARSPNCLPSLTSISLKGNYRLSDGGINAIIASAPLLSSINLTQCSLITSAAIIALADKLGTVLRELYLDHCQNVDVMKALPALIKLQALEVLSVTGIESVRNKFVKRLVADNGSKFKELSFADCRKLTAASLKAIGENCPKLCALNLCNVTRLTDTAICYLGNGCRLTQKLKLRRNNFSDEAVAAFVESSGESLTELTLNSMTKVGNHTALAISSRCSTTLEFLDLSFCRNVTDEGLGLIADNCSNLRTLKLFGCTQITNVFLEGHSNPLVKVIGMSGSILEGLEENIFI